MSTITLEYPKIEGEVVNTEELNFSESLLSMPYNKASLFVIQVDGESMQPHIMHNALVVADLSQSTFEEEGIFLVHFEENMWIKKATIIEEQECFVSINPKYAHLTYKANECRVIAKALLTFTKL